MAQQVKNVANKFSGKGIGALLGLAGFGYATTQSFYSGKFFTFLIFSLLFNSTMTDSTF